MRSSTCSTSVGLKRPEIDLMDDATWPSSMRLRRSDSSHDPQEHTAEPAARGGHELVGSHERAYVPRIRHFAPLSLGHGCPVRARRGLPRRRRAPVQQHQPVRQRRHNLVGLAPAGRRFGGGTGDRRLHRAVLPRRCGQPARGGDGGQPQQPGQPDSGRGSRPAAHRSRSYPSRRAARSSTTFAGSAAATAPSVSARPHRPACSSSGARRSSSPSTRSSTSAALRPW